MSKPSRQLEFLDSQLAGMLEPGEVVLHRGVAEHPMKWAVAMLTGGLLSILREFYYVVLTDRRLLQLATPRRRYFYFALGFLPTLGFSAGLSIESVKQFRKEAITAVIINPQALIHTILGWRAMSVQAGQDAMNFFVARRWTLIGEAQEDLYHRLGAEVARVASVVPKNKA